MAVLATCQLTYATRSTLQREQCHHAPSGLQACNGPYLHPVLMPTDTLADTERPRYSCMHWPAASIALEKQPSDLESIHRDLEEAISRAQASGSTLAALVVRLGPIQDVHEAMGRRASEALFRLVEVRWSATFEAQTAVYSFGDGAFAFLVPGATAESATPLAERILGSLEQPLEVHGARVQVSANVGIATYPQHGLDADTLLRHAEIAASEATQKVAGRAVYDASETRSSTERLTLGAELRQAVEQHQLKLRYQPQVDVRWAASGCRSTRTFGIIPIAVFCRPTRSFHCRAVASDGPARSIRAACGSRAVADVEEAPSRHQHCCQPLSSRAPERHPGRRHR